MALALLWLLLQVLALGLTPAGGSMHFRSLLPVANGLVGGSCASLPVERDETVTAWPCCCSGRELLW